MSYEMSGKYGVMADNYLEKHYDDYQKRKAEWERKKKLGLIRKPIKKSNTDSNMK